MIYGSVCSGIEAATVAWHPLGWRAAFFSEIEPFPRAVLAAHYQDVPIHGDFTTITAGEYGAIDLLVGGTPCQDFSVAGLRAGLDGDRGGLTIEFAQLARRLRPRWLVWENVPGILSIDGGRAFGAFLALLGQCGYGFAYRILDAQHFGVPQRRRRVFVVGHLGDWRPAAAVLFEPESLRGDSAPRREAGERVARPIAASLEGGSGYRNDADTADNLIAFGIDSDCFDRSGEGDGSAGERSGLGIQAELSSALRSKRPNAVAFGGNNTAGPLEIATACNAHGGPHGRLDFESETFVTHALRADGFDASKDGTGRGTPLVIKGAAIGREPENGPQYGEILGDGSCYTLNATEQHAILDTDLRSRYYPPHGNASETDAVALLRALRGATDEETLSQWGLGILAAFWPQEVLRCEVHGGGVRRSAQPKRGLVNVTLSRSQAGSRWSVLDLWQAGCDGCPPQGWRPPEQLAEQLGARLSRLPYSPSPAERFLHSLWQAAEGFGLLRQTLSAVEEIRRSAAHQGQSASGGFQVRRLTVEECEALQGFPRSYTAVSYRGKPAADGPRYRALGNSMAVPVIVWLGERIDYVAALQSGSNRSAA